MLTEREKKRYARQILLFGEEAQEKLKQAEVFLAGAGGLGSPVAIYLAVAGIGTIAIADNDTIELTNLNRQILHRDRDCGRKKVASAEENLREINPDIEIRAVDATIGDGNAEELVGNADVIVDAMDNYAARFLLNRAAFRKNIPLVHAAIRGLHGQATTVIPGKTPCLSCIFPHAPPGEVLPVLGATAGVMASIQATEVVKYLTGTGELLAGRLLLWDGRTSRAEEIAVERNPKCPVCGGNGPGA